ncbi:hypothetical protein PAMP_005366 [Pampus punctatissimus]
METRCLRYIIDTLAPILHLCCNTEALLCVFELYALWYTLSHLRGGQLLGAGSVKSCKHASVKVHCALRRAPASVRFNAFVPEICFPTSSVNTAGTTLDLCLLHLYDSFMTSPKRSPLKIHIYDSTFSAHTVTDVKQLQLLTHLRHLECGRK